MIDFSPHQVGTEETEKEKVKGISLFTTNPCLQSRNCHRAGSSSPLRDTANVAWQLHAIDGKRSAGWALQRDRDREWDCGTPGCSLLSGPAGNDTAHAPVIVVGAGQQSVFCWVGE